MEADAHAIAEKLHLLGYEVRMYVPDDENPNYGVVGARATVLELATLNQLTDEFESLAQVHNSTYDGWGAEVVE